MDDKPGQTRFAIRRDPSKVPDGESGLPLTVQQKSYIVEYLHKWVEPGTISLTMAIRRLARKFGRNEKTIWRNVSKLKDTSALSKAFIKAKAYELTQRIVKHADVDQAIDILSRPNIGVLEPIERGDRGAGLFISVNADSLGAVNAAQIGGSYAAGTGRSLPLQAGNQDATGVSGQQGDRGEEHDDWSDPYAGGVRGGRGEDAEQAQPDEEREEEAARGAQKELRVNRTIIEFEGGL